ncbi:hypothetical protein OWM54_22415 [Myxococcus sp. MISCRS1]|uniref:hypothetical protein n=1 Tax=Myxococcus TaxID=32 RepID=UPI00226FB137|nr:hypothetical protein [Myxococcus sp. MISCRS1]MCY0999893.1 hypothetical protein [Myxococcus sp. MISCRS1]
MASVEGMPNHSGKECSTPSGITASSGGIWRQIRIESAREYSTPSGITASGEVSLNGKRLFI